ncbi:MAG: tetratricopeptide repeat protein [Hydrogenophilales bacterium]|nr:tetratricopeptide repeat protein [Hydrogenophilales bacterium]
MNQGNALLEAFDLFKKSRYLRSREVCESILKRNPDNISAIHLMGKCEVQLGHLEKGLIHLQKIAEIAPDNAQLMLEIGNIFRLCKQHNQAVQFLGRALDLGAQKHTCYLQLGFAYKELSENNEAATCFVNALKLNPSCWDSARNLGEIYLARGLPAQAKGIIHKYLEIQPNNPHAHSELAKIHLALSNPDAALKACEDSLKAEPAYTRGFALKCVALAELDRRDELSYLFDTEKLVQRIHGKCPASFKSMGQFCKYLARHILNHPNLAKNRGDYLGAINGYHTGYEVLFKTNRELGAKVEKMICSAVDEYIFRLSAIDPNHPIHTSRPTSYRVKSWAVVTTFSGYAAPHIHPKSWVGGAFYVQLPEDFKSQATEKAGWIEFGRGEAGMHKLRNPITVSYEPVVGDFIMFPGYFWHSTVPLESTQKRICMAFDLEPINGWGK